MKLFHERTSPQPDAAASHTEAAAPPSASSPYAKGGRLDDFDIDDFLKPLEPENHLHGMKPAYYLAPDDPAYYLALVWGNEPIKQALRALPHFHEEIEKLCCHIDAGNWEVIGHHYMKETYPDNPELHGIRIKDMLFYAYAARRISRAEFNTAHMLLDAREQFQEEIQPEYTYKVGKEKKKTKINSWPEDFEIFKIYEKDEDKEGERLTDDGYNYINEIVQNLALLQSKFQIWEDFDDSQDGLDKWFTKIEQSFCKLPKNLQMFLAINNTLPSLERDPKKNQYSGDAFHQDQIRPEIMPLMAYIEDNDDEMEDERNLQIYGPSCAMLLAFLDLICPGEYVQPVVCLGSVSGELLAELHSKGFHPVTTRDDRSLSNCVYTHDVLSGSFYASMHDVLFHCIAASLFFPWQRILYCREFPKLINETRKHNPDAESEQYFARRLIETLADLAQFSYRKLNPLQYLRFFIGYTVKERRPPEEQNPLHYEEACLSFTKKFFPKLKDYFTGKNVTVDWTSSEDFLEKWEERIAKQKGEISKPMAK